MNELPLGNEELICGWGNDPSEVVGLRYNCLIKAQA